MDISYYDPRTAKLIRQVLNEQRDMDDNIFRSLARLKKIAKENEDDALMGFVYYQTADACYSMEAGYDVFRQNLSSAISFLRKADDRVQLTRAYNLVGIDATNNGSYDVAYYYFMMALRACELIDDDFLKGIVNGNIGQLYMKLGNMKEALRYLKHSNNQQRNGDCNDIYYYHNLLNGYQNEAVVYLMNGNIKAAERVAGKMERLLRQSGGVGLLSSLIPVSFLRTQMALVTGTKAEFNRQVRETIRILGDAHQLFDNVEEMYQFCMMLLEHGETKPVREILDIIGKTVEEAGIIQMMRMVTKVELAYFEKTGKEPEMIQQMRKMHRLDMLQEAERNRIYLYSIELIGNMDEMRKEQARIREENEELQELAQTDALTGVPNRLMMNKLSEEAFERAYHERKRFCMEILDIDRFKEYNDTYGHQAGDMCLKRVAAELKKMARASNIHCARYGGDEFVIIYEGMSDRKVMEHARDLERRIELLNIPHKGARGKKCVTVSQGLCNSVPGNKNKVYDYLSEADNALYAVKKNPDRGKHAETIRLCHLPEAFG